MSCSLTRRTRPCTTTAAAVAPTRIIAFESHTIMTPPAPSVKGISAISEASPCHLCRCACIAWASSPASLVSVSTAIRAWPCCNSLTMRIALSDGLALRSPPLPHPCPNLHPFGSRSLIRIPAVLYVTTHSFASPRARLPPPSLAQGVWGSSCCGLARAVAAAGSLSASPSCVSAAFGFASFLWLPPASSVGVLWRVARRFLTSALHVF